MALVTRDMLNSKAYHTHREWRQNHLMGRWGHAYLLLLFQPLTFCVILGTLFFPSASVLRALMLTKTFLHRKSLLRFVRESRRVQSLLDTCGIQKIPTKRTVSFWKEQGGNRVHGEWRVKACCFLSAWWPAPQPHCVCRPATAAQSASPISYGSHFPCFINHSLLRPGHRIPEECG